jgi:uncharacterized membrane protein YfcA
VLICLATAVAYAPALRAGYIWDDDAYIENNKTLKTPGGIVDIWLEPTSIPQYYPLVHTTYWLEFRWFGLHPFGYHLDNLLLHLGSVVLLFILLRRLKIPGALLTAGVFALHPVMVESVAWVTERKNVLSMVFYLSSASVYLRWAGLDAGPTPVGQSARGQGWGWGSGWRRRRGWWLAFGLFLGALASKSVTFSLPFAILLITYWRRGRVTWPDVRPLVPFAVVGVLYGWFTSYLEHTHVGASGPEFANSLAQKCLIAGRVPWFYLYKLVWPERLVFIYEKWDVDPTELWQWAFPLATVALVAGLFVLRRRLGRGPLTAVLLFGGTLFPALGFITVFPFRYAYVADHFQYHACLGVLVLACAGLTRWIPRSVGLGLTVAVLALYGVKTWTQCGKYADRETLYNSILADVEDSWFAHNNLAAIYVVRGSTPAQIDRAEVARGFAFYQRTKELNPGLEPGAHIRPAAYAHCMVGKMMANANSLGPALAAQAQRRSVEEIQRLVAPLEPKLAEVIRNFEAAIALNPEYVDALKDCARVYEAWGMLCPDPRVAVGRLLEAARLFGRALAAAPGNREVRKRAHHLHLTLAQGLQQMGQGTEAQAHRAAAQRLLEGDPGQRPGPSGR